MATDLAALLKQKEDLDRKIQQMQSAAKAEAIAQVRALMAEHGLMVSDFAAPSRVGAKMGSHVAPKYRDATTGATWSGRGLKPRWLSAALADGKSLSDFTI